METRKERSAGVGQGGHMARYGQLKNTASPLHMSKFGGHLLKSNLFITPTKLAWVPKLHNRLYSAVLQRLYNRFHTSNMHIKNKDSILKLIVPCLERHSRTIQQLAFRVTFAYLKVHDSSFVCRGFTVSPQIPHTPLGCCCCCSTRRRKLFLQPLKSGLV